MFCTPHIFVLGAGAEDGTALEMAFSRKKIEERKAWLRGFMPGTYLDHTASDISYTDFVNKVRGCRCTPHDCGVDSLCYVHLVQKGINHVPTYASLFAVQHCLHKHLSSSTHL